MNIEEELSEKRVAKILREQDVDVLPGTPALYAALAKMPTAKPVKVKGARYLAEFVEKAKKSGLVASLIEKHKVIGLSVAPPA